MRRTKRLAVIIVDKLEGVLYLVFRTFSTNHVFLPLTEQSLLSSIYVVRSMKYVVEWLASTFPFTLFYFTFRRILEGVKEEQKKEKKECIYDMIDVMGNSISSYPILRCSCPWSQA